MKAGHRASRWRDVRLWLLIASVAMLAATALRPVVTLERGVFRHLLVFDITQSMNVRDVELDGQPISRLELSKRAAVEALDDLPCGSSVGLGVFTGHRTFVLSTPVEVCAHYGELARMIEVVDWRMAWIARSEVAKGLYSALLASQEVGADTTPIFVSDGHEAPPINPGFRPRFDGLPGNVKGAIGGVGGMMPVPIPKLAPDGSQRGFWQASEVLQVDPYTLGRSGSVSESMVGVEGNDVEQRIAAGTEHLSSLRESYLRRLADELRLGYRRIDTPADMSALLLSTELATSRAADTDLRWLVASIGLLALVAVNLLPVRSREL